MAEIIRVGNFVIDTGFNESAWDSLRGWGYLARVEITAGLHSPTQPNDIALYRFMVFPKEFRVKTFYQTGSTSFPSDLGDRRIYLDCEVGIEFVRASSFFTSVKPTAYIWQMVPTA
jgi:hypothetical protein